MNQAVTNDSEIRVGSHIYTMGFPFGLSLQDLKTSKVFEYWLTEVALHKNVLSIHSDSTLLHMEVQAVRLYLMQRTVDRCIKLRHDK